MGRNSKAHNNEIETTKIDTVEVNRLEKWLNRAASLLDKSSPVAKWLHYISTGCIFLLVCFIFVGVFMRYVFNRPILGDIEITEMGMVVVIFFAIAYTEIRKAHINIDIVPTRLSPKGRLILNSITCFLSVGITGLIAWRTAVSAAGFANEGVVTQVLRIPMAPFAFAIPLGFAILCLILLRDFLGYLAQALRLRLRFGQWLVLLGVPILLVFAAILWVQPGLWETNVLTIAIVGVVVCVIMFFSGMPIAYALALVGFLGLSHINSITAGLSIAGSVMFRSTADFTMSVLIFFVLMGNYVFASRLGKDIFETAYKWAGHLPGGLAIATVIACTAFAAICGVSMASALTFGTIALPEMKRYQYSDKLATGCVAAAGTIAVLIPPSTAFIIYGILTQVSIGALFIAGIIPGLLLSIVLIAYIYSACRFNPKMGPPGEKSSWGDRLRSLKVGGPIIVLFVLVIGGIYAGLFTPSEAGAIGACVALIIGLIMMRFTRQSFLNSLTETTTTAGMAFLLFATASLFNYFLTSSGVTTAMAQLVVGLGVSRVVILIAILVLFLVLGCFLPSIPLIIIMVPIFFPVITALGYDPVWFGVVIVVLFEIAVITPPYALNLFVLKGVAKDVPMSTIYAGVMPFVAVFLVFLAIIVAFPQISTWLPSVLK